MLKVNTHECTRSCGLEILTSVSFASNLSRELVKTQNVHQRCPEEVHCAPPKVLGVMSLRFATKNRQALQECNQNSSEFIHLSSTISP